MTELSPPLRSYLGLGSLIDITSEEWLADDCESEEVHRADLSPLLTCIRDHLHEEHTEVPFAFFKFSVGDVLLRQLRDA